MELIEIKLPKCTVLLTQKELLTLLSSNLDIYKIGIQRGKTTKRYHTQKYREHDKLIDFLNQNMIH
ncbi:hypothetical protein [Cytobacillus oceanisediminis]|uniref:Uncharacterized protein n=1 Tax=Cytobacillus oceanisediminis 2691 TaxID=1196031 RepID=A0A160MFR7_9BACI|nr:hypothetical protein [Cytobacillus oceanisediminis]AND41448.1 hypothetical protein A361_20535 [Cytobacillus oceanisediminis 2691]